MELNKLRERLRRYRKSEIIITNHAELQAFVREIDLDKVKEDIINPVNLVYAREQDAGKSGKEKHDCYFSQSKNVYHRYILTLNSKIIIVTIIRINRDWQKSIG
ncbi:MAG: hypothetical protein KKB79_02960 [Nanoarchaeota archaeon]|nr:hypothetical protein [Nanoarchaeota archaeon]